MTRVKTSEAEFADMISEATFTPAEIAVLRQECGLPFNRQALEPYRVHRGYMMILAAKAWSKVRIPSDH